MIEEPPCELSGSCQRSCCWASQPAATMRPAAKRVLPVKAAASRAMTIRDGADKEWAAAAWAAVEWVCRAQIPAGAAWRRKLMKVNRMLSLALLLLAAAC